ncbi:hypothetical protein [Falsiroseomonas sp. CW058]|uniref:hypothetical protein n=1 Tax=Falsiroseomonas sp. CW058 TaxID=3388664 RepID=UPI003D312141
MASETDASHGRSLLGLRPPAELAEGASAPRVSTVPAQGPLPARPNYPVISSGWDSEDDEGKRSQSSDLVTALKAGLVLLAVIIALSLLLR